MSNNLQSQSSPAASSGNQAQPATIGGASTHRIGRRVGAAVAILVIPAASLAFGFGSATALPPQAGSPQLTSSVSTVAVAQTFNVRADTGKTFLQDGVVDPDRDLLYVADASDYGGINHLIRTDLRTGTSTAIPLGGGYAPSDVAVSPLDGTVYVAHDTAQSSPSDPAPSISVLDPNVTYSDNNLPPQIAIPTNHPQRLEIGADGRVYAMHLDPEAVTVIGASTGPDRMRVLQTLTGIHTDAGVTAIDPIRQILYVASGKEQTITALSTAASATVVLGTFAVDGEPIGLGYDSTRAQLVVSFAVGNTIAWVTPSSDLQSAEVTRTETLAPLPVGAADYSLARSLMITADGTALALTEVFPTEIKSFVSVVPPVVTTATPVYPVTVGNDGIFLIPDHRAGGTAYVMNVDYGTISALTAVTLSTFSSSHYSGTTGTAQASLVRADGRSIPGGAVRFDAAAGDALTQALDSTGTAAAPVTGLGVGSTAFAVTVASPAGISLAGTSIVVTNQNTSTTTLALNSSSITEGDDLTATATVALASGVASGSVTIVDSAGTVRGTGTLAAGTATVSLTGLPVGPSALVARFGGDSAITGSDSTPVSVTVNARPLLVEPNVSSGVVGAPVTVGLKGFAPEERVEVTLHSDPILLGTTTVDQRGTGSLQTVIPSVSAGQHHIVAVGLTSGRTMEIPFLVVDAPVTNPPATTPPVANAPATTDATAGVLASTGLESSVLLGAAGFLVLLGVSAGVLTRRARRRAA